MDLGLTLSMVALFLQARDELEYHMKQIRPAAAIEKAVEEHNKELLEAGEDAVDEWDNPDGFEPDWSETIIAVSANKLTQQRCISALPPPFSATASSRRAAAVATVVMHVSDSPLCVFCWLQGADPEMLEWVFNTRHHMVNQANGTAKPTGPVFPLFSVIFNRKMPFFRAF